MQNEFRKELHKLLDRIIDEGGEMGEISVLLPNEDIYDYERYHAYLSLRIQKEEIG